MRGLQDACTMGKFRCPRKGWRLRHFIGMISVQISLDEHCRKRDDGTKGVAKSFTPTFTQSSILLTGGSRRIFPHPSVLPSIESFLCARGCPLERGAAAPAATTTWVAKCRATASIQDLKWQSLFPIFFTTQLRKLLSG